MNHTLPPENLRLLQTEDPPLLLVMQTGLAVGLVFLLCSGSAVAATPAGLLSHRFDRVPQKMRHKVTEPDTSVKPLGVFSCILPAVLAL